ncbi:MULTISPECIES: acyltransferase family protein [Bacteria]|uniref:acyltransferase family protein n=1 Tax=Bacteria TaxID=2 RepID=UPI003C7D2290
MGKGQNRAGTVTRIAALEGVRGTAAAVVVLHHALLTVPVLALPYFDAARSRDTAGWLEGLIIHSPLHILWEGTSAVFVFFVLSGYVLFLSIREPAGFDWGAYYPSRLIRLYLPTLAALALAALLVSLTGRADGGQMASLWVQNRPDAVSANVLLRDATLLFGAGGTASPLWSLQWEIWFSLLLPLFVFLANPRARQQWLWVGGTALLAVFMLLTVNGSRFMLLFLLGALLASNQDRLAKAAAWANARARRAVPLWGAAIAFVVLFIPASWTLPFFLTMQNESVRRAAEIGAASAAATVLLTLALYCPPVRALFERRALRWLGTISFSLYLVHEPIIVGIAKIAGDGSSWWSIPGGIAVSLLVAIAFHRWIEAPSTSLARRIRSRIKAHRATRSPDHRPSQA